MLPCSFFLCVIALLDLEKPSGFPSCNAILLVEDSDGLLSIGEVEFKLDDILRDSFRRNSEAFLELGDVEHVMYGCQVGRELYSVGDWSTLFHDWIGSDITGS